MKKHTLMYLAVGGLAWWLWKEHQRAVAAKAASVAALAAQAKPAASPLQQALQQNPGGFVTP